MWSQGHKAVPSCPLLARQHQKRVCWDDDSLLAPEGEEGAVLSGLVGGGAYADTCWDKTDFDAYTLADLPDDGADSEK